jgi:hypothetical protein
MSVVTIKLLWSNSFTLLHGKADIGDNMAVVRFRDPFLPVLLRSRALVVSDEQKGYLKDILTLACSDSRFAEKAYVAIIVALTAGITIPPVVTSLVPSTIEIGQPDVTLHVHGTGFTPASLIIFNGVEEPTTFVSPTELTTGINMSVWLAAAVCPVVVRTDSIESDPVMFTFTEAPPIVLNAPPSTDFDMDLLKKAMMPPIEVKELEVKDGEKK